MSFIEHRDFVRSLGLKNAKEWQLRIVGDMKAVEEYRRLQKSGLNKNLAFKKTKKRFPKEQAVKAGRIRIVDGEEYINANILV